MTLSRFAVAVPSLLGAGAAAYVWWVDRRHKEQQ